MFRQVWSGHTTHLVKCLTGGRAVPHSPLHPQQIVHNLTPYHFGFDKYINTKASLCVRVSYFVLKYLEFARGELSPPTTEEQNVTFLR